MGFEAVKKIAAWQALHDRFQYIVLGPLRLLTCFWFPTMLARPWTGASIRRHGISGVRRWCWVTCVSYCLWNHSPQGWVFNFAGGRWRRELRPSRSQKILRIYGDPSAWPDTKAQQFEGLLRSKRKFSVTLRQGDGPGEKHCFVDMEVSWNNRRKCTTKALIR